MHEFERRSGFKLDEETINEIVERVANRLLDPLVIKVSDRLEEPLVEKVYDKLEAKFFQGAGRIFIDKVLYLSGIAFVGILYWLNSKDLLKF